MTILQIAGCVVGVILLLGLGLLALGAYLDHKEEKDRVRRKEQLERWQKAYKEAPEWIIVVNQVTGEAKIKQKDEGRYSSELHYTTRVTHPSAAEAEVQLSNHLKQIARNKAIEDGWHAPKRVVEFYLQPGGGWTAKRLDAFGG